MATIIENDKGFKVICISRNESAKLGFGVYPGDCICMDCNELILDKIYYIAALNDVMCETCYKEWYESATHYKEDAQYENKYFDYYSKKLGL